jgi:hypothetical protein
MRHHAAFVGQTGSMKDYTANAQECQVLFHQVCTKDAEGEDVKGVAAL